MKNRWTKIVLWVLATPFLLFFLLMFLLYVPPIQYVIREKATAVLSEKTGLDIKARQIGLRFPLTLFVNDVTVVQFPDSIQTELQPDTLLSLQELDVRVQLLPLFKGKIEVDNLLLSAVKVNSASMIPGMEVKGELGRFFLKSHGVDFMEESILLNETSLSDTHLYLQLSDTTSTTTDSTSTLPAWKLLSEKVSLNNVSVKLDMPLDTLSLHAAIPLAQLLDASIDLKQQAYGWRKFLLENAAVSYDMGVNPGAVVVRSNGLDPNHLSFKAINLAVDTVYYSGHDLRATIQQCSFTEQSGLDVRTLTARVQSDSTTITMPQLSIKTPHSAINLNVKTYWELLDMPTSGQLTARLDARIGKSDVMLLAGALPETFKKEYPSHPLVIRAATEGNLSKMQISRISADLPGAFSLNGGGELWDLDDDITKSGKLDFRMETHDLNFLTALTGVIPEPFLAIPDSMTLEAQMTMEGEQYRALLALEEHGGHLVLDADYYAANQLYRVDLYVDSLQLNHFLPNDSLYNLSLQLSARGMGFDPASSKTSAHVVASLHELHYDKLKITDVDVEATLEESLASLRLLSNNKLLNMKGAVSMRLDKSYLDGWLNADVKQADLYALGLAPKPLERPVALTIGAEARRDSVKMHLVAGDLDLKFRTSGTLKTLLEQGNVFADLLNRQISERHLNHAELRRSLPSATLAMKMGKENPVSAYLATKDVSFDNAKLNFGTRPERGINGRTAIHGLRIDTLQLDTIFLKMRQDTTRLMIQGGVSNGPKNPQLSFSSTLTGEVRNDDAELTLECLDDKGNTGILLGLNARPLMENGGKADGLLLRLTPAEPVIAFRKFHFLNNQDWLYLHNNLRVYAGIEMESDDGLSFRMQSDRSDSVALQNINIELEQFKLDELNRIIPYIPQIGGWLSVEANYVKTEELLQVNAKTYVDRFTYENREVGDFGLKAEWLPVDSTTHHFYSALSVNGRQTMMADGMLMYTKEKSVLNLYADVNNFPLEMANAFLPSDMIVVKGYADAELALTGTLDNPVLNGSLSLDSVATHAPQVGASYRFDNRPLIVDNNKLIFDNFSIFTTSENPFIINGNVDFRNLKRPTASLTLKAKDYTLLNAPRTKDNLLYGKIFVDLNANIRGPLDGLVMRGNMSLLGKTNATYVLTDSPLTVEDRLDGLVTFTSFTDTLTTEESEAPVLSLGGIDMIMSVHIDDAVRLRADLTPDGSKYVVLEGGGDLTLQYTPYGDMALNGRYTLSGGVMKYSLPVIPLKEFQFIQGSYLEWRGDVMNPLLDLKATERLRASVADEGSSNSRMINFDASVIIKNKLSAPDISFDLSAPEDPNIENELQSMSNDERNKAAITMIATGTYLGNSAGKSGFTVSSALNSVLQSQINSLAGAAKNASITVGIEDRTSAKTGNVEKDFNFRYSQRLFNNRVQIIIGGKVSTDASVNNSVESFIDNVSLEYRLDNSGTRYVRAFYNKNYESVLDGEITETGAGIVLRKKMDKLSELFIFNRPKKEKKRK